MRYSLTGALVGFGGVVFSFFLGCWVTYIFSAHFMGEQLPFFHPICLFMGIASTATSVGITARILSEKKKLDSPEGVTILSAAVIDDVFGMILLAVVLGIAASARHHGHVNWGNIVGIGVKAFSIWLIATFIGIIASRRISLLLKMFRDRTAIAIMALGLALILSGLFEEAGLAMIIGAYVMGLSLSQADISHLVRENKMSTGLEAGIAIPHGKTDAVKKLVCAVGIKHDGIDFKALDGKPSQIFILTLSPKSRPTPHIQLMSTISHALIGDGSKRVLAAKSIEEIYTLFTENPRSSESGGKARQGT